MARGRTLKNEPESFSFKYICIKLTFEEETKKDLPAELLLHTAMTSEVPLLSIYWG